MSGVEQIFMFTALAGSIYLVYKSFDTGLKRTDKPKLREVILYGDDNTVLADHIFGRHYHLKDTEINSLKQVHINNADFEVDIQQHGSTLKLFA